MWTTRNQERIISWDKDNHLMIIDSNDPMSGRMKTVPQRCNDTQPRDSTQQRNNNNYNNHSKTCLNLSHDSDVRASLKFIFILPKAKTKSQHFKCLQTILLYHNFCFYFGHLKHAGKPLQRQICSQNSLNHCFHFWTGLNVPGNAFEKVAHLILLKKIIIPFLPWTCWDDRVVQLQIVSLENYFHD